jgi:hypothetical protein
MSARDVLDGGQVVYWVRRRSHLPVNLLRASAHAIGSLPIIMLGIALMLNYAYASTLFSDPRGLILVGCGLVSYIVAIGFMAWMALTTRRWLLVPAILFILPPLLVVIVGPALLRVIDSLDGLD